MASESDFLKQKALLEQQIQFLENRNAALDAKEKELAEELKQQKKESHSSTTDLKNKYDQQVRELHKTIETQKDQIYDWESKYQDLDQKFEQETTKWKDLETNLQREIAKLKETHQSLQTSNESLKKKLDQELAANSARDQEENAAKDNKIADFEVYTKELEEEIDSLKSKYEKDSAISQQKLEFLQVQLDQERAAREEQKKNHERLLSNMNNNARESVIGKEEANKKVDELKEKFAHEYQQLQ